MTQEKFRDRILRAYIDGIAHALKLALQAQGQPIPVHTYEFMEKVDAVLADADERKRCKTCKHWEQIGDPSEHYGACHLPDANLRNRTMWDQGGGITTDADFGCVQWEGKDV